MPSSALTLAAADLARIKVAGWLVLSAALTTSLIAAAYAWLKAVSFRSGRRR